MRRFPWPAREFHRRSSQVLPSLICLSAVAVAAAADEPRPPQVASTNDGAFEVSQAARGKVSFLKNCSTGCHMPGLTGGERAPALAGDVFLQRWKGQTLEDLFMRIKSTMPQQNPQSLSDQTYADVLAFILQANGLPPGAHELPAQMDSLRRISIDSLGP
jgi:S-disulfanyl-L-cysteine oxidoreductase SoxD